ncbi:UNVERIFIED_CONTAM: hypothetical protein RMT77_002486 [Armadillidium vulgare]
MTEGTKASFKPEDFELRSVQGKDYTEILALFREHFLPREQISIGLELPVEEHVLSFQDHLKNWIECEASVCAVYVPTQEIVGALLTKLLTRNDSETFGKEENFSKYSSKLQMLLKILNHIENTVNVFEEEKLEKVLELAAITVNPKFSGQKIVYKLIEETEKRARQMRCQLIITQAANIISQHVFVKAGYETCSEVDYDTLELDGKRPLKVSNMNGTTKAIVVKKHL